MSHAFKVGDTVKCTVHAYPTYGILSKIIEVEGDMITVKSMQGEQWLFFPRELELIKRGKE